MDTAVPLPPLARGGKRRPGGQSRRESDRAEPNRSRTSRTQPSRKQTSQPRGTGGVRGADAYVARSDQSPAPAGSNSSSAGLSGPPDPKLTARGPAGFQGPVAPGRASHRSSEAGHPRPAAWSNRLQGAEREAQIPRWNGPARAHWTARDVPSAQAPPPWSWMTVNSRTAMKGAC